MKIKAKMFSDIPVNGIIAALLLVFFIQAFLVMFYNNNSLAFSSLHVYNSLARGAGLADANFAGFPKGAAALKEINGFLYPVIVSIIYKITGKYNLVPVIYVLSFFLFLFVAVLFYRVACGVMKKEAAAAATAVFITSAPVALSMFSGGDVVITFLLMALNAYFIFYHVPAKKYGGAWITTALMCATSLTGLAFGLASFVYILARINEKNVRKNYARNMAVIYTCVFVLLSGLLAYVFIGNVTAGFFEQNGLVDTKTFQADTFFKDGFLWSKALPPFFAFFFYVSFFMKMAGEIKAGRCGFTTYAALITLAALLMEFFAVFSVNTDTVLFMGPFYFIAMLVGISGITQFAEFIQHKKAGVFGSVNIFYGIIVFMIVVNTAFLFSKSVERDNNIRYIIGNGNVEKFIER